MKLQLWPLLSHLTSFVLLGFDGWEGELAAPCLTALSSGLSKLVSLRRLELRAFSRGDVAEASRPQGDVASEALTCAIGALTAVKHLGMLYLNSFVLESDCWLHLSSLTRLTALELEQGLGLGDDGYLGAADSGAALVAFLAALVRLSIWR